jgi:hypothetical protein
MAKNVDKTQIRVEKSKTTTPRIEKLRKHRSDWYARAKASISAIRDTKERSE